MSTDTGYKNRLQAFHERPHGQAIDSWLRAYVHRVLPYKLLDYGCGLGLNVKDYALSGLVGSALGYDPVNVLPETGPRFELTKDRARVPGEYDVVVCTSVLGHVRQPLQLIAEFSDWVSANGLLLLTIPSRLYEQAMFLPNLVTGYRSDPTLLHRWYAWQLRRVVEQAGFSTVEITGLSRRLGLYESVGLAFTKKRCR